MCFSLSLWLSIAFDLLITCSIVNSSVLVYTISFIGKRVSV